jgi:putative glycosyltransferase (TIGR04348 family)
MVCPAPPGSLYGNRVTALRWAGILRGLGHQVTIVSDYQDEDCDLLIALHARRSGRAALRFRQRRPCSPLIVALTGTDLYRDLRNYRTPRRVLEVADRIVALQPLAAYELDPEVRGKLRVIYQSAEPSRKAPGRASEFFDICVVGHLRAVKDPFRAAYAARHLPRESRIRVLHAGGARDAVMHTRARAEEARNPRYQWVGALSRIKTRRLMAQSRLLVLSSRMEGGANVISEAVVDGTPVIASRIPGSIGLLGADYPGYFPVGDTGKLARLLKRAESDAAFYRRLATHCRKLAPMFRPAKEREQWRQLLAEITRESNRAASSRSLS